MEKNGSERRSGSRFELISQVFCVKKHSMNGIVVFEPRIEVYLVNLSGDGLSIRTSEVFVEGEVITFDIILEEQTYNGVNGKILWHIKEPKGFRYGLSITNMSGRLFSHAFKVDAGISDRV